MKKLRWIAALLCFLIAMMVPLNVSAREDSVPEISFDEVTQDQAGEAEDVQAEGSGEPSQPSPISIAALEESAPIDLNCTSALLVEPKSGQIIFEKNADERRPVASVTKVMAILLACEAVEQNRVGLEESVSISKEAAGMGGSQVLLDIGEEQPFSILLKSMIVGSANDATVAIGEYLYGSEQLFVQRMNERAKELGMADTNFVNSTGLPAEGHYTTTRDVARMMMALIEHPLYFEYSTVWLDEVDHGDGRVTSLTNTNRLIRLYDGCDGGKTGSTNEAGYCIAATAKRGDMRLLSVVLGAPSGKDRFDIAGKMMDYGFATYRTYTVVEKGARVRGELPVIGGDVDSVQLLLDGSLSLLMQKGGEGEIALVPNLPEEIQAPFAEGHEIGSVDVVLDGRTIARIPVVAAEGVNRQGFWNGWQRVLRKWFYS